MTKNALRTGHVGLALVYDVAVGEGGDLRDHGVGDRGVPESECLLPPVGRSRWGRLDDEQERGVSKNRAPSARNNVSYVTVFCVFSAHFVISVLNF